jgi:hypothetical protein
MIGKAGSLFDDLPLRLFFVLVAALFALGAVGHAGNILSLNGFQWSTMPLSWRILDGVFLILDLGVVIGVTLRSGWAVVAFLLASGLQVALYTVFSGAPASGQTGIVRVLLYLNITLLVMFAGLVWRRGRQKNI